MGRHWGARLTFDFTVRIYQTHRNFGAANIYANDKGVVASRVGRDLFAHLFASAD